MHGLATRLLLLLLAVVHCFSTCSPTSADNRSESEDDDWEEHHDEYTYTELNEDEESREQGLEKAGYHFQSGGSAGAYGGAAWAGSKKSGVRRASQVAGAAKNLKASSKHRAMTYSVKGKRRKAAALNQQSARKKTKRVNKASQFARKQAPGSKKRKSPKKGAKGKMVGVSTKNSGGLTMIVKKNPKIWSSGASAGAGTLRGSKALPYKWSPSKGSKETKVAISKRKGGKQGKAVKKGAFVGAKKGWNPKTSAGRRKGAFSAKPSINTVPKGKKRGNGEANSKTKRVTVKKNRNAMKAKLSSKKLPFFSNFNAKNSNKGRLRGFVKQKIGVTWPAVKKKFGFNKMQTKATAQRSPSSSRFSSKGRNRFGKANLFKGSKKDKTSGAVVSHAGFKQAGFGSKALKSGSQHLRAGQSSLAHERTSWSGLGAAHGEKRSRFYGNGFLIGTRSRRKKGRIIQVLRIRHRRRKHRSKKPVIQLSGLENNSSQLEPNDGRFRNGTSKPDAGGGLLEQPSNRLEQGGGRFEKGSSQREHDSGRLEQDGGRPTQGDGQHERGSSLHEHGSGPFELDSGRLDQNNGRHDLSSGRLEQGTGQLQRGSIRPEQAIGRPGQGSFELHQSGGQPTPGSGQVPRRQTAGWNVRSKPREKVHSGLRSLQANPIGEIDFAPSNAGVGNESLRANTSATPMNRAKKASETKEPAEPGLNLPVLSTPRPKVVAAQRDAIPEQNLPIPSPLGTKSVATQPDIVPEQSLPPISRLRTKEVAPWPKAVHKQNLPVQSLRQTQMAALRSNVVPEQNLPSLIPPRTKVVALRPAAGPEQNLPSLNPPRTKGVALRPGARPEQNLPSLNPPRTKGVALRPDAISKQNPPSLNAPRTKGVALRPGAGPEENLPSLNQPRTKGVSLRLGAVPQQNLPSLNMPRTKGVALRPGAVAKQSLPSLNPPRTKGVALRPDAVPEQNLHSLNTPRTQGVALRPDAVPERNLPVLNTTRTHATAPRKGVVPEQELPFLNSPRTKAAARQPHAMPMQNLPVLSALRSMPVTPRLGLTRKQRLPLKAPLALRNRKMTHINKAPGINSTTSHRRKFPTSALPESNAPAIRRPSRGAQKAPDIQEPLVPQRPSNRHHGHHRQQCQGGSSLRKGKAGKIVGGGLMWFPAASCAAADLDWNSVHSTACLHQQIAFVHRYKVLTPALHPASEEYSPGFCGSYVPWNHIAPHHVTDLAYDGSIVSGLSLHRFGFVNPGGYTFELLPHTGRLILVGVPFHRRALSLCHLDAPTLGLLFTGTGVRNGALGMQRLGQICGTLETYVKTKPGSLYWGFPTVPVRTAPVAVRVPDASTEAVTPVLPIASDSAEEFTLKVFTEPLTLYPEVPVDYTETHTNFLEPVMFVTEPIEHVVRTRVETVASPVVGTASETVSETVVNGGGGGGVNPVIETHEVEVVHPAVQTVHEHVHVITGPEVAVDALPAVAQAADVYSDVDGGVNDVGYHADLEVDEPGTSYYLDFAEPVVHVTEQVLCFPGPAI
ncbi:uncharacterized protein LOC144125414 [Amblyomma americanum]